MSAMVSTDQARRLLDDLRADVRTAGIELEIDVADLGERAWLRGTTDELPPGFGSAGFVLRLPGWDHLLTESSSLSWEDLADAASSVRDWVIDRIARPWPQLPESDGRTVVLDPVALPDGVAWRQDDRSVAVGSLHEVAPG